MAEADRSSASDVVGENAGSAIRIMPLLIMITFAPPATVSRVRASMSARGSRNVGEVIPWSSAQITDTPAGSITRLSRMDLPVFVVIVPPRSCGVWQTDRPDANRMRTGRETGHAAVGRGGRGRPGPPLD